MRLAPDDILAGHSAPVVALAQRLRQLVQRTVPDASERAYPGWRAIGYRHPRAGYFCAIFPHQEHVALAFEFGAYLPDPDQVLVSGPSRGARVRYLEVRRARDLRVRPIERLLRAAIALRSGKATTR